MKYKNNIIQVIFSILLILGCAKVIKNPFLNLERSTNKAYGYTAENPIRLGYSKSDQQNIYYCRYFLENLRTTDKERLLVISRGSLQDPKYKSKKGGFLGIPIRGSIPHGGILDIYTLVTENQIDTINLYFDIYHKEPIKIPLGLIFIAPIDSIPNS